MSVPVFRRVPALRGAQWLVNAWYLFTRDARAWMLFVLVLLGVMLLLAVIPLVGPLVFGLVFPIFCAGLALAARAAERGEPMRVDQLFAGFRTAPGDLVAIGGFYLVGQVVVTAVMMGIGGAELESALAAARKGAPPELTAGAGTSLLLAAAVGLALLMPLMLATWFAPLLVFFDRIRALPALQVSLRAGLCNWRAFVVYAVGMLLALVLARVVVVILSYVPVIGGMLATLVVGALLAVFAPVAFIAFYTSYVDVFAPLAIESDADVPAEPDDAAGAQPDETAGSSAGDGPPRAS